MTIEEKAKEYVSNTCSLPLISTVRAVLNTTTICQVDDMELEDMYKFGMIEGFISGMKEATRWIPVEESLPEEDVAVFVLCDLCDCPEPCYAIGRVYGKEWDLESTLPYSVIAWRPIEFK